MSFLLVRNSVYYWNIFGVEFEIRITNNIWKWCNHKSNLYSRRYSIFWFIVTLAGLTAAVTTCTLQFMDYYRWLYYITESVEVNATIPAPDVTICNAFPFPNLGTRSRRTRAALDDLNDRKCFNNRSLKATLVRQVMWASVGNILGYWVDCVLISSFITSYVLCLLRNQLYDVKRQLV